MSIHDLYETFQYMTYTYRTCQFMIYTGHACQYLTNQYMNC